MSEVKHTPGPWVVNPLQLNQICTKENPKEIAKASVSPHAGITAEQAIANAQLMAASESLLKELIELREAHYRCLVANGTEDEYAELALKSVDDVIAIATEKKVYG